MKSDIHPKYYAEAAVTCACGNTFKVGSTDPEIRTELCSACHPFYTGKQKLVDTARRVEKFKAKIEISGAKAAKTVDKKAKQAARSNKRVSKKSA